MGQGVAYLLAGLSTCLSLIFCKFLVGASRFVRGVCHPLATPWLRVWCVLWYYHSKQVATVQRLRETYERKLLAKMSNYKWHKLFSQTRCIREGTRPSKRPLTEAEVNEVRVRFVCCPNKRRLRLPTSVRAQSTMHKTLPISLSLPNDATCNNPRQRSYLNILL